jgi:hypothetical protein
MSKINASEKDAPCPSCDRLRLQLGQTRTDSQELVKNLTSRAWEHQDLINILRRKIIRLETALKSYTKKDRCAKPVKVDDPDANPRHDSPWRFANCGNCQFCQAKALMGGEEG